MNISREFILRLRDTLEVEVASIRDEAKRLHTAVDRLEGRADTLTTLADLIDERLGEVEE